MFMIFVSLLIFGLSGTNFASPINSQTSFHMIFSENEFPNIQPIELKNGGLRMFYSYNNSNEKWISETTDYMTYTVEKSTIIEDSIQTFIFKNGEYYQDNQNSLILYTQDFGIQTSIDEGKSWVQHCPHCLTVNGLYLYDAYFDPFFSASWNVKNKVFMALFYYTSNHYIAVSQKIDKWHIGSEIFPNSKTQIPLDIFDIALSDDLSNTKTILISKNMIGSQDITIQFVEISLDDENEPTFTIGSESLTLDQGVDVYSVMPASTEVVTSSKTIVLVLKNNYIKYGTNNVNFEFIMGIPRKIRFNSAQIIQSPLLEIDEKWHLKNFSINLKDDVDPFECFHAESFVISSTFEKSDDGDKVAFLVRANSAYSMYTEIGYSSNDEFYVDRRKAGNSHLMEENAKSMYETKISTMKSKNSGKKEVKLLGFVDRHIIEVVDGEEHAISCLIFPAANQNKIKIVGKKDTLVKVKFYTM